MNKTTTGTKEIESFAALNAQRLYKLLDSIVLFMLLGHLAFVGLFWYLGRTDLLLLNTCMSVPALTISLILIRKRLYPRLRLVLPYAELLVHSVAAVIILGWESGFYLYLVAGIVLTQIYPWRTITKVIICGFLAFTIGMLYAYHRVGLNEFPDLLEQTFFLANLLGVVLYMTFFLFFQHKLSKELETALAETNSSLGQQKAEIEHAHYEIRDSIAYAQRIQSALLPTEAQRKALFPDSFLLYSARDVVAGDFFWLGEVDGRKYAAVADCTGHGVPGAMVSVVCINALKRAIHEFQLVMPGQILTKTRDLVVNEFGGNGNEINDGMDIALVMIHDGQLHFSGAHNSLFILRSGELIELKGDKQPVGKYVSDVPFSTQEFGLQSGDFLILFSDGFVDQFGGEKGKKYKTSKFKELLIAHSAASTEEKYRIISQSFLDWKGDQEQVDDVSVLGIKM